MVTIPSERSLQVLATVISLNCKVGAAGMKTKLVSDAIPSSDPTIKEALTLIFSLDTGCAFNTSPIDTCNSGAEVVVNKLHPVAPSSWYSHLYNTSSLLGKRDAPVVSFTLVLLQYFPVGLSSTMASAAGKEYFILYSIEKFPPDVVTDILLEETPGLMVFKSITHSPNSCILSLLNRPLPSKSQSPFFLFFSKASIFKPIADPLLKSHSMGNNA